MPVASPSLQLITIQKVLVGATAAKVQDSLTQGASRRPHAQHALQHKCPARRTAVLIFATTAMSPRARLDLFVQRGRYRKGARPVPGPIMMIGKAGSAGSRKSGFLCT